jgi:hypothetical protein
MTIRNIVILVFLSLSICGFGYLLFILSAPGYIKITAVCFLFALLVLSILILTLSPYMKRSNFKLKNNEAIFTFEATGK